MDPSDNMESDMDTDEASSTMNLNLSLAEDILNGYFERYPPPIESGGIPDNLTSQDLPISRKVYIYHVELKDELIYPELGDAQSVSTMNRLLSARIKYMFDGDPENRDHVSYWIIKMPSMAPINRQLGNIYNFCKREIFFYTDILPKMKAWVQRKMPNLDFQVPTCFYAKFVRNAALEQELDIIDHIHDSESLLVLQDMRAFEYGKRYFGTGLSYNEAIAAIAEISKFHAVSYAMEKATWSLPFAGVFAPAGFIELYVQLFKAGAQSLYEMLDSCGTGVVDEDDKAHITQAVKFMEENIEDILKQLLLISSDIFPSTLLHMDLWSDNLLFHIKDEDRENNVPPEEQDLDCVIIDWQMVSYGIPTHDIALLILISMDAPTRRKHTLSLLHYYYERFENLIGLFGHEMPFTLESLVIRFHSSCVLASIMAISSMDLIMQEETAQLRLLLLLHDLIDDKTLPNMNRPDGNSTDDMHDDSSSSTGTLSSPPPPPPNTRVQSTSGSSTNSSDHISYIS